MRKLSGFATMLALGIALAPAAFAGDASTQAAAEALFREGRALMQQGKYPEACQKLKESQRLDPGAGTLLNLAACYERGGQTASAWATYREAAASAARSGRKDWEATARERAHQLEPTLSSLTIDVPPGSGAFGLAVGETSLCVAIQLNNEVYLLDKASGAEQAHLQYSSNVFIPSWVAIDSQSFYWTNRERFYRGLSGWGM